MRAIAGLACALLAACGMATPGPPGPRGVAGPPGPPGPAGAAAAVPADAATVAAAAAAATADAAATAPVAVSRPILRVLTADTNVTLTDDVDLVVGNNVMLVVTLPSAATAGRGRVYTIVNPQGRTIIAAAAKDKIGFAPDLALGPGLPATLVSDGRNWLRIGN